MKLIIGLGNIGTKYKMTRHNIGFAALDSLQDISQNKKSLFSEIQKTTIQSQPVIFAKPQTLMNLSGKAASALVHYYDISMDDLLVIHDDIDLDFMKMKLQKSRGPGGHNGILDIHEKLGTKDYYRLKLGVGHPRRSQDNENSSKPVQSYVLSPFNKEEFEQLSSFLEQAHKVILHFIEFGGKSAKLVY